MKHRARRFTSRRGGENRARTMQRRTRGFTLIELLIALAIFALLSTLGYRAMVALTDSESRLAGEAGRWRALDLAFARLEADVRTASPRPMRTGTSASDTLPAWLGRRGADGQSELVLARAGSEFFLDPGSAGQRIGYRLRHGTLEVLYWPYLDQPADTLPTAYALAGGIAAFRLEYLDGRGQWHDAWPSFGEPALPGAVHVALDLADGGTIERWMTLQ